MFNYSIFPIHGCIYRRRTYAMERGWWEEVIALYAKSTFLYQIMMLKFLAKADGFSIEAYQSGVMQIVFTKASGNEFIVQCKVNLGEGLNYQKACKFEIETMCYAFEIAPVHEELCDDIVMSVCAGQDIKIRFLPYDINDRSFHRLLIEYDHYFGFDASTESLSSMPLKTHFRLTVGTIESTISMLNAIRAQLAVLNMDCSNQMKYSPEASQ